MVFCLCKRNNKNYDAIYLFIEIKATEYIHIYDYLEETIVSAGMAYLLYYIRAVRTIQVLKIDERNGTIKRFNLVKVWTIVCRSDVVRGNMGLAGDKVG